MREIGKEIEYNGKKYLITFNLNVMEVLQEKFGTVTAWGDLIDGTTTGEPNAQAVIYGYAAMLNEGIDIRNDENGTKEPFLTLKQVGRMLTSIGIANAAGTVQELVVKSTQSAEKNA